MSPRAAWRLEALGYGPVYDYVTGKSDWVAAGLPTARADTTERRALDAADTDPPTCHPSERIGDIGVSDTRAVIVLNDAGVVVGGVRPDRIPGDDGRTVEDAMELGPATVRAHEPLDPLMDRMATRNVTEVIVTTPEGKLLGVVRRR